MRKNKCKKAENYKAIMVQIAAILTAIKLASFISTATVITVLLYMPPAHLVGILESGCGSLPSCTFEALARTLDGRLI